MMPEDGAIAEIQLGEFHYRVFRPFAGTVKIEKARSFDKTITLVLMWRPDSNFLEMFEPNIVHEVVVLILSRKWTLEAEATLAMQCEEKYKFSPVWGIRDYAGETHFSRPSVATGHA